jgi:twitching motility protein PilT
MATMDELLRESLARDASDLHLSAGEPPLMRVHGDLVRSEHTALAPAEVSELVNSIMSPEQRRHFESEHEVDFSCELSGQGRFRVNVFMQSRGPGAVLRAIPTKTGTGRKF